MKITGSVSFQGEPGAYSELAAFEYFGKGITTLPCDSFDSVFSSVTEAQSDLGLVPVENSLAGSIHRNYDLLLRNDLFITGEYHLRVNHCLLAVEGSQLEDLEVVYSHPQALAQCENNIKRLGLEAVARGDTAGSAHFVSESGDHKIGAIASTRAAKVYMLKILENNLEDNPANFTRFVAISREPAKIGRVEDCNCKTSIVFSLDNKPGVLFKALSVFALRDIDLSKIESRPLAGKPWEYFFYVDFYGHAEEKNCTRALDHLSELAPFLRILGSYPSHKMTRS